MIETILKLFGYKPVDYKQLMADGAIILDVRTIGEYNSGHVKGSVNMPLNLLDSGIKKLDKTKPVITCCASGMRSASAKNILKSKGYTAYNAGSWNGLNRKLSK